MFTMLQDIDTFLAKSKYANTTKTLYRFYLNHLAAYLDQLSIPLNALDAAGACAWLEAGNWHSDTRYAALCALRAFVRHLFGDLHPALGYKTRRRKPRPQRTLSTQQVQTLLASINTGRASGVRNLAMVTLMLDTGFRAAEICRLELRYLDIEKRTAWVIIKGGDWGLGVFCDYTASCLNAWLPIRERLAQPGVSNVFVAAEAYTGNPLTPDGLRSTFRALGAKAGLGAFSPHDLRRTFCTLALENGAPTRVVQKAGRWESIDMVTRYSQMLSAFAILRYSPVAKAMGV